MVQVKCFVINGTVGTIDGRKRSTLAKDIEDAVNKVLETLPGEYVATSVSPLNGALQDSALVTVSYQAEEKPKSKK